MNRLPGLISAMANRPPASLTDAEIDSAVAVIAADPRTKHVSRARYADEPHHAMLRIVADDCAQGALDGTYSIGRVVANMRETEAEFDQRARDRARTDAEFAQKQAECARIHQENLARLDAAGLRLSRLFQIRQYARRGIFIDDDMMRDWQRFADLFDVQKNDMDIETILACSRVVEVVPAVRPDPGKTP